MESLKEKLLKEVQREFRESKSGSGGQSGGSGGRPESINLA